MNDRPSAEELLDAVACFLQDEAVLSLEGSKKYQARVAANVVRIVAQELRCEERHLGGEWERLDSLLVDSPRRPASRDALHAALRSRNQELVERIRRGDADSGPWRRELLSHLRRSVADKLEVARPPRPG